MFGTLVCDVQHEPLTFVENKDPASALSRNRRAEPHASCELCRARKIRCSGQRSGCDRCIAMSVECKYRDRNGRRKRKSSASTSSTSATHSKQPDENPNLASLSATMEATPQQDQIKQRMDDWQMDTEDFLDPMLCTQLESPPDRMELPGEIVWNSVFGEGQSGLTTHAAAGTRSIDLTANQSNIPSPTRFEPLLAPPLDLPLGSTGLEKLELEAQQQQDSEAQQQLHDLALQQLNPFIQSLLQPGPGTLAEDNTCLCRRFKATLFEELCAESANTNHAAMDVLLRHFRGALSHCTTVLDCERCSPSASGSNMLLVMAGQYMSTICERMAMCYASKRQRNASRRPSLSRPRDSVTEMDFSDGELTWEASSGESSVTDGDMWFSTYRIESGEERLSVLRCLVMVQLNDFARLLERLKARAGSRSVCLVLLTDAERRLRSAESILLEASNQTAASKSF